MYEIDYSTGMPRCYKGAVYLFNTNLKRESYEIQKKAIKPQKVQQAIQKKLWI